MKLKAESLETAGALSSEWQTQAYITGAGLNIAFHHFPQTNGSITRSIKVKGDGQ